jgi:Cu/Ag efflux protein CusF
MTSIFRVEEQAEQETSLKTGGKQSQAYDESNGKL